jgi:hypothetical protein
LSLPSDLLPSVFPPKPLTRLYLPHSCYIPRPSHRRISPVPRSLCMIPNIFQFLWWGIVSTSSNPPKLEDHPFSAVRDCLFNIFAATVHMLKPFLLPQVGDAPCRGGSDPLIAVRQTQCEHQVQFLNVKPGGTQNNR